MECRMKRRGILALAICLALALPVLAQSSANYDLTWNVVAGGGGRMASGAYRLLGTAGQPLSGMAGTGSYGLCSGFWCGVAAPGRTYLPLVLRNL